MECSIAGWVDAVFEGGRNKFDCYTLTYSDLEDLREIQRKRRRKRERERKEVGKEEEGKEKNLTMLMF